MKCREFKLGRSFDIELDYGDGICAELSRICQKERVETGIVSAGLGGFGRFQLSFEQAGGRVGLEWKDVVLQLSAVQGFVLGGKPEVHATVTVDGSKPLTWCGRVEAGCERLFYCELLLTELLPAEDAL